MFRILILWHNHPWSLTTPSQSTPPKGTSIPCEASWSPRLSINKDTARTVAQKNHMNLRCLTPLYPIPGSFLNISQPPLLTTIHPAKNRAPRNILLMVQTSCQPVEVGRLSPLFTRFYTSQVVSDFFHPQYVPHTPPRYPISARGVFFSSSTKYRITTPKV